MTLEKARVQLLKGDSVEVDTTKGEACPVEWINNVNDNSLCIHTGGNYSLFSCILLSFHCMYTVLTVRFVNK